MIARTGLVLLLTSLLSGGTAQAAFEPISNELPEAGVYDNAEGSPLLPLLKNASTSIDIEIYSVEDPTVRRLVLEALGRGVPVRILKEARVVGDKCDPFHVGSSPDDGSSEPKCAELIRFVAQVRKAGGTFKPFNKKTLCPNGGGPQGNMCVQHGKMVLADGLALLSTGNFDRSNLCIDNPAKCNRDFSLIIKDPEVYATLHNIFEADLKGRAYDLEAMIPVALKGRLTISPLSLAPLIALIDSAKVTLDIEQQYLNAADLNAAIERAARRNVKVRITVASACAFGRPDNSTRRKITKTYGDFDQLGVSSSFFNSSNRINGLPGYMHAKALIIDGKRAWVGSVNGSVQSLTQNREFGYVFDHADWVRKLSDIMTADHDSPDSETWAESLECAKDTLPRYY